MRYPRLDFPSARHPACFDDDARLAWLTKAELRCLFGSVTAYRGSVAAIGQGAGAAQPDFDSTSR